MEFENLRLSQQLCFALYSATHAITRLYKGSLEKVGLTYPQYLVMIVLWEADKVSVKHIAERLDLDSASLTPILKRLEKAGFLGRVRNTHDERALDVSLTQAGRDLQAQVADIQQQVVCKTGLAEGEFNLLKEQLNKLTAALNN